MAVRDQAQALRANPVVLDSVRGGRIGVVRGTVGLGREKGNADT